MKKLLLISTLFFLQLHFAKAQINSPIYNPAGMQESTTFENHCATDEMQKELYNKYPARKRKAITIDSAIYEALKNASSTRGPRGIVYTIPVVVHIIHNNGSENISNAQVIQGIQDLNDAFANQGFYQDASGVDVEIQFCLAQRDPNNNATNGITRDVSTLTNMTMETDDIALKNISRWNPSDYLNIWVVKAINSLSMGPGVVGYAFFPSSHGQPEDGIVNEAHYFGSTKDNSKVHVHEAGHYLGLYHTFEAGCINNNCLTDGDKVCDTPPDNSTANVVCTSSINTCTTDDDDLSTNNPFRPIANGGLGDQNDLFHDHMDYGDLACHTLFTQGQKDRMRLALTGARASLLQSQGCNSPCTNPISISFTSSATTVIVGTNVNFTNTSTGAITNYNWSINNISFATTQNSNYIFNTVGNYWVLLTENNNTPNCKKQDSVLIKVLCNIQASFTSSASSVSPGGQLTFTSTSTNATNYQWYIDGVAQVTTPTFTHVFSTVGGFMVYLVACNNNCCDTSFYQYIKVGTCFSKEGNIWYFGFQAGLDFNNGAPIPLTNSAMNQNEGCSTISDRNGQLLFYTNGVTVWDKNHQVMQNGTGLWGHNSSTQSALIVKQPGSNNLYYIFTCAAYESTGASQGAFAYSIVDINLNNGIGAVTIKNKLIYKSTTEKQVAVRHSNGTDVWLISHASASANFYSYLLTCNGLDTIPVINNVGSIHPSITGVIGQMAISPNGKKLAVCLYYASPAKIDILDFNTTTGIVSNPFAIPFSVPSASLGVAFSPDASKLYYCNSNAANHYFFQINLNAGSASAILNSATVIHTTAGGDMAQLQLAPDGKIYGTHSVGGSQYLSVVQNPNALGLACGFSYKTFFLGGKNSFIGLQNLLVDYFSPKKASKIQGDTIICNTSTYSINCGVSEDSIVWLFHGHSTIISTGNSTITIKPNQLGIDTLISIQYAICGKYSDTLLIHTKTGGPKINLGKDTIVCNPIAIQLDAGSGYTNYLWSTTAITQTINVSNPGIYWVEVNDTIGCSSRDTIKVVQGNAKPNVNLGADKLICSGQVIVLDALAGYMNYTWQDNSHNQSFTAWLSGKYWVTVNDSCGNSSKDTINLIIDNTTLSIGVDTMLCENQTMTLNAGPGYISYLWQDGSTNQTYAVNDTGVYSVKIITSNGCEYVDTIKVTDCIIKTQDCEIGVPDAFSPNGDGMNDVLKVLGSCIDKITFVIYDRWGEKVFETTDSTQGWDGTHKGKRMDNAVFAYYLKVTTFKGTEINLKGNVSLIR